MAKYSSDDKVVSLIIRGLRGVGRRARKLRGNSMTFYPECTETNTLHWKPELMPDVVYGAPASDLIFEELQADKPSMICRFGTTELATITSIATPLTLLNALKVACGDEVLRDIGMNGGVIDALCKYSGFFPPDLKLGEKFYQLMLADMPLIDILGVWVKQERFFTDKLRLARKVRFRDMEPYLHENPWSRILKGKKVLVIHPFTESISAQYEKRAKLFENPLTLPEFELRTIKAVQSIAHNKTEFKDWFAALESMQRKIDACDFDIAIIGCGAYGMPLAAHVKRIGKKAVHMGGQTQLMFGIKGKRWETGHEEIRRLFNEHWIYPDEHEKPKNFQVVEGGAYW